MRVLFLFSSSRWRMHSHFVKNKDIFRLFKLSWGTETSHLLTLMFFTRRSMTFLRWLRLLLPPSSRRTSESLVFLSSAYWLTPLCFVVENHQILTDFGSEKCFRILRKSRIWWHSAIAANIFNYNYKFDLLFRLWHFLLFCFFVARETTKQQTASTSQARVSITGIYLSWISLCY